MIRCALKYVFGDKVNDPSQKYNDGDLINSMHHFQVNVRLSFRILFSEEISKDFIEIKVSPLVAICLALTHEFYMNFSGSIQAPSFLMIPINSSTASADGTFRFTTFMPLYSVILPLPDPT